jgi:hypothetical protein
MLEELKLAVRGCEDSPGTDWKEPAWCPGSCCRHSQGLIYYPCREGCTGHFILGWSVFQRSLLDIIFRLKKQINKKSHAVLGGIHLPPLDQSSPFGYSTPCCCPQAQFESPGGLFLILSHAVPDLLYLVKGEGSNYWGWRSGWEWISNAAKL